MLPSIRSAPDPVREALDVAWAIDLAGRESGDRLYGLLESYDDEGLLVLEYEAPADEVSAWLTVTTAVAYVARQAYALAGVAEMPASMYEVDEDSLVHAVEYFLEVQPPDRRYLGRLVSYLRSRDAPAGEEMPAGRFNRDEVIQAGSGSSG